MRVVVNPASKVTNPKVCVMFTSGGDVEFTTTVLFVHLVEQSVI